MAGDADLRRLLCALIPTDGRLGVPLKDGSVELTAKEAKMVEHGVRDELIAEEIEKRNRNQRCLAGAAFDAERNRRTWLALAAATKQKTIKAQKKPWHIDQKTLQEACKTSNLRLRSYMKMYPTEKRTDHQNRKVVELQKEVSENEAALQSHMVAYEKWKDDVGLNDEKYARVAATEHRALQDAQMREQDEERRAQNAERQAHAERLRENDELEFEKKAQKRAEGQERRRVELERRRLVDEQVLEGYDSEDEEIVFMCDARTKTEKLEHKVATLKQKKKQFKKMFPVDRRDESQIAEFQEISDNLRRSEAALKSYTEKVTRQQAEFERRDEEKLRIRRIRMEEEKLWQDTLARRTEQTRGQSAATSRKDESEDWANVPESWDA